MEKFWRYLDIKIIKNIVMQIMAEVTVELGDTATESVPDINISDTMVGKILEEEGDSDAKKKWQKLVRKLSIKRKRQQRLREEVKRVVNDDDDDLEETEESEDNVPDDWKPDFIPKHENTASMKQPDVVPTVSCGSIDDADDNKLDADALDALVRYRSSKR